ncbi:MAG TPA: hypothetical protein VEZ55_10700 [Chitinophagaceae bacterium]|nr:hypothetical protein [Chitinophagaceae bacterium]
MTEKYMLFFFSLILFIGCKKEEETNPELLKLPPATQTGANTCGCLINGKAWVMNAVAPDTHVVHHIGPTYFFYLYGPDSSSLTFVLRGYSPVINTPYNIHNGYGWSSFRINGLNYGISGDSAVINFTRLDTANKIMSGSFHFAYQSPTGNQQDYPAQLLTDCRFDFRYRKF